MYIITFSKAGLWLIHVRKRAPGVFATYVFVCTLGLISWFVEFDCQNGQHVVDDILQNIFLL